MSYNMDKVYLLLRDKYNGKRMPTSVKMAEETGLSRQTVSRRLKKLIESKSIIEKDGLIFIPDIQIEEEDSLDEALKQLVHLLRPNWTIITEE